MRIIVVALAVALVTASSSTAAFVVTSKNIKNSTIQLVDISPRAKKALRGQRGPRGPVGIEELTVVNAPRIIPAGTGSSAEATCPAGQQPIAGGFGSTGNPTITTSAPNLSNRSWLVIASAGTTPAALAAIAYCAKNVNLIPLGP
jgi:hypothetical protein